MKRTSILAAFAMAAALGACSDIETTRERSALLNSRGPVVTDPGVDAFLQGLRTLRRFYANTATFTGDALAVPAVSTPPPADRIPQQFTPDQLRTARTLILAYVDSQCDAYVDAIFWANRTRQGVARGNNAIGSAVGAILGATSAPSNVMGIVAAAFGLSGNLFDTYYASVLYGLEPSSVRHLIDQSQLATRARINNVPPTSEAVVLQQVQDYIRQCTPAHIEFLVHSALKKTNIKAQTPSDVATILFIDNWQLKADGTSVAPDGTAFSLQKSPPSAPFQLLDNGQVKVGGSIIDYKAAGVANWGSVPARGRAAPAGILGLSPAGAAPEPAVRTDAVD